MSFEFPLLNGRRVWIAKGLEVKSGFAILKQHWPWKKKGRWGTPAAIKTVLITPTHASEQVFRSCDLKTSFKVEGKLAKTEGKT